MLLLGDRSKSRGQHIISLKFTEKIEFREILLPSFFYNLRHAEVHLGSEGKTLYIGFFLKKIISSHNYQRLDLKKLWGAMTADVVPTERSIYFQDSGWCSQHACEQRFQALSLLCHGIAPATLRWLPWPQSNGGTLGWGKKEKSSFSAFYVVFYNKYHNCEAKA